MEITNEIEYKSPEQLEFVLNMAIHKLAEYRKTETDYEQSYYEAQRVYDEVASKLPERARLDQAIASYDHYKTVANDQYNVVRNLANKLAEQTNTKGKIVPGVMVKDKTDYLISLTKKLATYLFNQEALILAKLEDDGEYTPAYFKLNEKAVIDKAKSVLAETEKGLPPGDFPIDLIEVIKSKTTAVDKDLSKILEEEPF